MTDNHWESSYRASEGQAPAPSQFAAFVAAEYLRGSHLFDIGCGNGRDTLFFSNYISNVVGVDGSQAAINNANAYATSLDSKACFVHSLIENQSLHQVLLEHRQEGLPLIIYSRFFLHAISEAQQTSFFDLIAKLCSRSGDIVALEFRTVRDRDLPKVTSAHYRRYIDPISITTLAGKFGFSVDYFIEGFGFAKYKNDDAYVARLVLSRP